MSLRVVAAAVRTYDGVIHTMPRPARHHDILHALTAGTQPGSIIPARGEQGFLLSDGSFVDRVHAARIAISAGQVYAPRLIAPPKLYSEDLW